MNALQVLRLLGEWEKKLKQIENGSLTKDAFMNEITTLVEELNTVFKSDKIEVVPGISDKVLSKCPKCGNDTLKINDYGGFCDSMRT